MKPILDLLDLLPGWLWAAICAGALGWGGAQTWRVHSLKSDIAAIKQAQAEAVAAAEKAAREESDRLQGVKDAAIAEAEKRAATNAAAAGRAQSELVRLRNILAAASNSTDPACKAAADRAAAISTVFGECSTELVEMGRRADAHASDLRTFYDAWPANADFQKRLDAFTQQLKGNRP
jgi:hypothetical protein